MKHVLSIILVLLFIIPFGQVSAEGTTVTRFMKHKGFNRKYIVHLPEGFQSGKKYPLLIVLHGAFGTAKGILRASGFNQIADREGFVVVYPQGYKRTWSDSRNNSKAAQAGVDDVDFIRNLVDLMKKEYSIERSRVYATGISNGGFMSFTLACKLSSQIAAIAPITANFAEAGIKGCEMKRPVPLIVMNGTKDPLVPYNGGEVNSKVGGKILSTDKTMELWAEWNDWKKSGTENLPDKVKDDGATVKVHSWKNSKGKATMQLYEIVGGGHTWPGGTQYLPKKWIGTVCKDFSGSEVAWAFLKRHTL